MPKLVAFRCADSSNPSARFISDARFRIWTAALLFASIALAPQCSSGQESPSADRQSQQSRVRENVAIHPSATKLQRRGNLRLHLTQANRAVFLTESSKANADDVQSCVFSLSDQAEESGESDSSSPASDSDTAAQSDTAKSNTAKQIAAKQIPTKQITGDLVIAPSAPTHGFTETALPKSDPEVTSDADSDRTNEPSQQTTAKTTSNVDADELIVMPSSQDRADIPAPDFNAIELMPSHAVRESTAPNSASTTVDEPNAAPALSMDSAEAHNDSVSEGNTAPRPNLLTGESTEYVSEPESDSIATVVQPEDSMDESSPSDKRPANLNPGTKQLVQQSTKPDSLQDTQERVESELEWVTPESSPSDKLVQDSKDFPTEIQESATEPKEETDYEPRRTASSGIPLKLVSERKTLTLSSSGDPNATSRRTNRGELTLEIRDSSSALTLSNESLENSSMEVGDNGSGELTFSTNAKESDSALQFSELALDDAGPAKDSAADRNAVAESGDKECPGAPKGPASDQTADHRPEDVPLEQQPHPYDAPKATSEQEPDARIESTHDYSTRELVIHRKINETLDYFMTHPENVARRGPWALMHASLPFGVETEVVAGNRRVNALGWMCHNGVCYRQRMFQPTRTGFRTNVGPGVQGHEGQFLAILAQSRVQSDYPIKVGNRTYSIQDLVRYEMATCREKSELTFKLIGLSYYLQPDQRWRDNRGRVWNLEKMVAEELAQPINGVACGGSHRLMGLSYAIIERQRAGEPLTGHWARAEKYLNDYVNYTMTLQNQDGSFSTNWFEGRGNKQDTERKVQTTGHMLEWLIYTLPDDYLRSPRIQVSIEYLLNNVGANPGYDWPIGPRGHALRAMALYNQRVFGAEQGNLGAYITAQRAGGVIR